MTELPDNDLARRWRDGEAEAYNELVRRHLDAVHRFLHARCGNGADADDLCQEVFLEVCLKIGNFDATYPFTAWLYTIARRKAIDRFRRHRPTEAYDAGRHGGMDAEPPSLRIEQRESAREAWEKVFRLLPENQATALWLRVQAQHSIDEISTTMDQSVANVKVLLFRARQRLAREWRPSSLTPT